MHAVLLTIYLSLTTFILTHFSKNFSFFIFIFLESLTHQPMWVCFWEKLNPLGSYHAFKASIFILLWRLMEKENLLERKKKRQRQRQNDHTMFRAWHVRMGDQKEKLSNLILQNATSKTSDPFSFFTWYIPKSKLLSKAFKLYFFSIYRIKIEVDHVIQPQPQPHHLSIVSQSINQSHFTYLISQKILMGNKSAF